MTLVDSVNLWMMLHNNEFYFQSSDIDTRINKDHIYHIIMSQYADLECVYSDTSYMHKNVELFWIKNKDRITRLLDTLDIKYDPIENYSTVETGNLDANGTKKFTQKDNTSSTTDETINTESKHFVSAFNNINGEDVSRLEILLTQLIIHHSMKITTVDRILEQQTMKRRYTQRKGSRTFHIRNSLTNNVGLYSSTLTIGY